MTFESTESTANEGIRHAHWRDLFGQLCEFKVQFGHCTVPGRYSINPKLGLWVGTQRRNHREYKEGRPSPMTAERSRALGVIGFDWGASKADVASIWNIRFQQLCEFKVQFGHCLVPRRYPANPKLGIWCAAQRYHCKSYQEGKPSRMTAERIRELESIGFDWSRTGLACIWGV